MVQPVINDVLGAYIGYLPQSLEPLAGTVKDNIARFDSEASDHAVIEVAKIAGVHEMILQLPDGYATQLGFDVRALSGGQVQRVGLGCAIAASKTRLLFFTSADCATKPKFGTCH